ncbi:UDP-N-acetylmuramoyl-L-alanine--D-glutamate ligase [Hugenholtzia roseola]|uniref:UDP-N-acetylmuramoyl-L-alanine--D-glutamate ligase n=1 Tax=Hugenholtzia roseola TaxID=1002 RepID=UPI0004796101|nr:UDP-N-acetylmuramoyl-L-alanine--D-glutamate ligase [Hugenholtzia roseola]
MKAKNIIVLGGGESGVGAALLAKQKGYQVLLSEGGEIKAQYRKVLLDYGILFEEGGHSEENILAADEVIKSPGIPEKVPIIQKLRTAQIPIISEIEFASRFTNAKIIAITGTNGKTTTTLLTHHLLKTAGLRVALAGNVGNSFAKEVFLESEQEKNEEKEYDYYVLEVSSFQLDDIADFKPHIAVITNITPDHLDRYLYDMDLYAASKLRIFENQTAEDYFVYDAECEFLDQKIKQKIAQTAINPQILPIKVVENRKQFLSLQDKIRIATPQQPILDLPLADLPLKGLHNQLNMSIAATIAQLLEIPPQAIAEGLATFVNAPHRLEVVRHLEGVTYVNDSKATNVDSVFYALPAFEKNLVWIVGGVDKGNDYNLISDLIEKYVRLVICLGKDNTKIVTFMEKNFPDKTLFQTFSMEEAVRVAHKQAKAGEMVLLSPACASFDLFKNYEDRGEQFKKYVNRLGI